MWAIHENTNLTPILCGIRWHLCENLWNYKLFVVRQTFSNDNDNDIIINSEANASELIENLVRNGYSLLISNLWNIKYIILENLSSKSFTNISKWLIKFDHNVPFVFTFCTQINIIMWAFCYIYNLNSLFSFINI